jgi:hypothetical protein
VFRAPIRLPRRIGPNGRTTEFPAGDWRYVVRRPGDRWPTDEHVLVQIIAEIEGIFDGDDVASETSPPAAVRRLRAILRRLAEEGWIDYESSLSTGGH